MKFSVITPNFNGARFLEETIRSVISQRMPGVELQYIIVDGGSTDGSLEIIERYRNQVDKLIVEKDRGPADAINKGLKIAQGDWVAWLNADDFYLPNALERIAKVARNFPEAAFLFGRCLIVDDEGREIRKGITFFKELFFPFSSRFVFQCINYVSQPATFIRRSALEQAGLLRLDLKAAFDYELFLRLWHRGRAQRVKGEPIAAFRWHSASISGRQFRRQFEEEFEVARRDAGAWSLQTLIHWFVRWGIVWSYTYMNRTESGDENRY